MRRGIGPMQSDNDLYADQFRNLHPDQYGHE